MRARLLIFAAAAGGAVLLLASPASADDRPGGTGGAYVDPGGNPTAVASDGGSDGGDAGGSGGGGTTENPCPWRVVVEDDFAFPVYDPVTGEVQHSSTGRWLGRWCDGDGGLFGYFMRPDGELVDPHQLALDALASVTIGAPTIRTSPSEDGTLYVQVPTWLWLEQGWWQPHEATANAGRVWSTVRASPVATVWSLGDGESVSCRGPGTPWHPGMPEGASDCTHTYRSSSASRPGGTFHIEATVTIEVSWTTNVPGGGGTLPGINRASSVDVEVGEIQAIGTQGGQ